ncbi:hypothetical protein [Vibrio parahaemolyticus]|uniref:hypothetical protein n=1 Tax=Vibrio parahaemolyticus TaxID=670 RepID=UPI0023EA862C|nr:hypothetical protein [Vibrio parahaemolyticus]
MKIESSPGRGHLHDGTERNWVGDDSRVMQIKYMAGHEMMAIQEEDDSEFYELHYLGFRAKGFKGMEAAKASAGEFARAVLSKMATLLV